MILTATLENLNWREARFTEQDVLGRREFHHYCEVRPDRGDFGWISEYSGTPVGVAWANFSPVTIPAMGLSTK